MKAIIWVLGLLVLVVLGTAVFIWSGAYNIAADEPHWPLTEYAMETVRERSIAARASVVVVPDLVDEAMIQSGAGNYDAMCVGCHLQPGVQRTELSNGLFPAPPNLSRRRIDDPAAAFWVIKHGMKMSGMPAWGKSMDDESIWGMVAFLQRLPDMSQERYEKLLEASAGHQHGGTESAPTEDAEIEDHSKAPPHQH
jgi:mono/diheme cytochrome c family protein